MNSDEVARRFGLGRPTAAPLTVPGGLSNEMWRLTTESGAYAVKRMVVNADRPEFVANVEAAFRIEQRAWHSGVAMPEPVPDPATGKALVRLDYGLVRVHRWVDGRTGAGTATEAMRLLAEIHASGERRRGPAPEQWHASRWGADLVALTEQVRGGPAELAIVDSHRDLDGKNTIRRADDGVLMAIDWDAAGPAPAVHEAVATALDWTGGDPFAIWTAVAAYHETVEIEIPRRPWVFAGWVAAQGQWLDYNADHRADTELGRSEVARTLSRLQRFASLLREL